LAIFLVFKAFLWLFVVFCSIFHGLTVDGALGPTCPAVFAVSTQVIFSFACIVFVAKKNPASWKKSHPALAITFLMACPL